MKKTSLGECEAQNLEHGNFAFHRKRLGAAAGGEKIGVSWFELPPGKKTFPLHYHLANEEAVFVLEGEGVLRLGPEEHALKAGDYVVLPPGPPGHQLINRGAAPFRFLALSSMIEPEVVLYPESNKLGVLARKAASLLAVFDATRTVDYYEGEE